MNILLKLTHKIFQRLKFQLYQILLRLKYCTCIFVFCVHLSYSKSKNQDNYMYIQSYIYYYLNTCTKRCHVLLYLLLILMLKGDKNLRKARIRYSSMRTFWEQTTLNSQRSARIIPYNSCLVSNTGPRLYCNIWKNWVV